MLYCFTDESYSSKNYFQGALIVKEEDLIKLEELIEEILLLAQSHGVPSRVEIHGHSIMNAAKGWQALDRKLALKIVILKEILKGTQLAGGKLLIAGIYSEANSLSGVSIKNRHIDTHRLILERIDRYAELENDEVMIYADETSIQRHLSKNFQENKESYKNLKELSFLDSKSSPGIQLVDVCLYIFHRVNFKSKEIDYVHHELASLWELISLLIPRDYEPEILLFKSTEGPQ